MGLITASVRKMYLNSERLDLEYKIQLITQAKMGLSESVNDLLNVGTDTDPDSPVVKQLEQRKEKLYLLEKKLDMQMQKYQEKLNMIEAEMQSCEKMFEKNVQSSFKY